MVKIIPAEGALCGEHYVLAKNGERLGMVTVSRGQPRLTLYVNAGTLLLRAIADQMDEQKDELTKAAEIAGQKNREWEEANGYQREER